MKNELIILAITLLDLSIILLAWRFGKEWVIATILANIILVSTFNAKLVPFFGYAITMAAPFYSAIFVATDTLTEHHGKKVGYRSVWMGFLALATFTLLGQLVLLSDPIPEREGMAAAMETLFSAVPRIAIASFTVYIIAQSFDIWLFHYLREKTGKQKLWLRNNISTIVSQLLDSCLFFPLAFAGSVSTQTLVELIITGWLSKVVIALLDTPFIYLSYVVKGKTPPDFAKRETSITEASGTAL
ncbi:MAG: queuosine precursor transporter [Candidatus Peribacteraceae bacterium]|jgi:hypothetical protein|nr:hypothetical protein [bacterium]MDP6561455.1 queuosine precursor transporter [Candidatus Peribacteraceae bacterium]|tara:strand:- start:20623 stop:21354 length:732 start_codon:yes stop_codon:yes gene_type:complete